ncbi:bifunctional oligoribonuclease/PAP phosphatase NrnA [Rubinisphaera sp.]|uniref:DHH family phosphoesterase n=1 Tax=Rubinisphaera sp. TaxID=2024857 RepID=UPI000C0E9E3A|nr:bifunctional oligoribonuclease/PAP phosphatase NrnA [Rubinisphaera sp.]MBV11040.1 phosphoesterase [Rubinisphaera sp.]HCS51650.1 phosphoesterase [Planctomycetaceae bacterium]|tara:strand:- start:3389 stop:4396 length:1008 start_codon:yes stop_codon:yes gene_type:complete
MNIDWSGLRTIIDNNQHFVITSHVRPDADALGSELALAGLLESMGKTVEIINPSSTPKHLFFLDPENKVHCLNDSPALSESLQKCDVHIVVDTSAWIQIGDVGKKMQKSDSIKVVIDHHASSDDLSAHEFKDVTSPAAGCLIYDLMVDCGYHPTSQEANALYSAIATDTGWFRFPATTAETMQIISALMKAGASPSELYTQLYEQASLERLKLSGIALQRVQLACEGQLVYTYVTQADFAETKAHPADTESLVNECMKIKGTRAAFILVQQQNRQIKASLRSREGVDVTLVAEQFGGGGHRLASGAMITGSIENVIEKLIELFQLQLGTPAVASE